MSVRVRAAADYYAVLGIQPDATADEVNRAFRALAKELHPDRGPTPQEAERFKDVTAAYDVLGDPTTRRAYDDLRRRAPALPYPAPVSTTSRRPLATPTRVPMLRTRRRARQVLVSGVLVFLLGLGAGVVVVSLQRRDAAVRSHGVEVTARYVPGADRRELTFITTDGTPLRTRAPLQTGQGDGAGSSVQVIYDRTDPKRVVFATDTSGRDLTLWIIAIKLVVCGAILAAVAGRRLHRGFAT